MSSRGIARRTALLLAALLLCGVALGCGKSDNPAATQVEKTADRSGRITALKREIARLKKRRAARHEREHRSASAASGPAAAGTANDLVAGLAGRAGVALGGPGGGGPRLTAGSLATGAAWSTIKVPIVERVLEDAGGPGNIDRATEDRIHAAITLSDNEAAASLFARLESGHGGLAGASQAVGEMLRAAGDSSTVISTRGRDGFSTYGQTEWSLVEQARYMASLAGGCTGHRASGEYILGEMARVGGYDTYGLGSTGLPGRWKGGWGPGPDGRYLVRQMGVTEAAGGPVVVAMGAIPDDGTFESGQAMLNEIAARIVARFGRKAPLRQAC